MTARRSCIAQAETNDSFEAVTMLITFSTDAYAVITLFGDVALAILKIMANRAFPLIELLAAAKAKSNVMWK